MLIEVGTDSLQLVLLGLTVATALAVLLALGALLSARRARRRLTGVEQSLAGLEQSMQSAATLFAESDMRMNAACEQISQLARRQGSLDAATGQSGFKQAIALTRRGASVDEIMDTCGISQGEARLISTMYGAAAGAPN